MKKSIIILLVMSLVIFTSAVASAHHNWNGHNQPYDRDGRWQHHSGDRQYEESMPFRWHDHRGAFQHERHRLERINDREWERRFPDLHAYHWYGHNRHNGGFWHEGNYIRDAILFFDNDEEVVAFGYVHDGRFIMVRQDHEIYENHESFYLRWWNRHGGVVIRQ